MLYMLSEPPCSWRGRLAHCKAQVGNDRNKSIAKDFRMIASKTSEHVFIADFLRIHDELNQLKDVDTILDRILFEARKLANADAGSIYLVKDNALHFACVQNDTLFTEEGANAAVYSNVSIPITECSIVGHSALSGATTVIDDAYNLSDDLPFTFNASYDERAGYKTTSIMTVPLKGGEDKTLGVMQIINARDNAGVHIAFTDAAQTYLPLFANMSAVAVERGIMTRELILRMMKMAELRDPAETGAHVQRVGAYSAEIYHRYALNKNIPADETRLFKDRLRLAAMLHDAGKVAIPDAILKKPAKLTNEEFAVMKHHTLHGARLFINSTSELDDMCCEIALNHHEKWAGNGYPGSIANPFASDAVFGTGKKGAEIPLSARICALADVYDALVSRRCYKEPFPEEKVLEIIREDSGTHFDPDVVEAFFQIHDVILAIRERFPG